jgi:hypothetical protein
MKFYPIEFYILWEDFEPWTPSNSIEVMMILQYFVTADWYFEIVRERLTELYDKEFVDRMIPWRT